MYDNDLRTGTDYEYNHGIDAFMQQSYTMPYQPKSLSESLTILREYKDTLPHDQYASIESTIRGQAIGHQYCDRFDIELMVKQAKGEVTYEKGIKTIKERIKKDLKNLREQQKE